MRRIIAALQVSLDGFIEGPNGELGWVQSWEDPFDLLPEIDTCILGRVMYPGYEQYWRSIKADPTAPTPFGGQLPTPGEVAYAEFADQATHIVLSRTLDKVNWHNSRIVRDVEDIRKIKAQAGMDIHAVGGATLVGTLMNAGLVDELRVVVQPILLGAGKALFKDVRERRSLKFVDSKQLPNGPVRITYTL